MQTIITQNVLFGDNIGEVASNQALLDLPKWLTDGYIAYLGQHWSTDLDDELKSEFNQLEDLGEFPVLYRGREFHRLRLFIGRGLR